MLLQGSICGYGLILWDGMNPEGRVRLPPAARYLLLRAAASARMAVRKDGHLSTQM